MMDYSKQRFERLFKDSYPHMYRMAFSMVEDADYAKDAVNQVFTQMWKGKPKVSEDSVRGYLLAATRNQCLHILRQRQLQQQMEEELLRATEESFPKRVKVTHIPTVGTNHSQRGNKMFPAWE